MYTPNLGVWLQRDPAEEGLNLFEYVDDSPANLVDPYGLADTPTQPVQTTPGPIPAPPLQLTTPGPIPQIPSVMFIETDDFRLSGQGTVTFYINRESAPKGFEKGFTPTFTSEYTIVDNFYKSFKAPRAKDPMEYGVPDDAGEGYGNSFPVSFSGGAPVDLRVGNPIADLFLKDYVQFEFEGRMSTKQDCYRFNGQLTVTVSGSIVVNDVKATQPEISKSRPLDFGNKQAKTLVKLVSGSTESETHLSEKDYVLFKIGGGTIEYKIEITGGLYK